VGRLFHPGHDTFCVLSTLQGHQGCCGLINQLRAGCDGFVDGITGMKSFIKSAGHILGEQWDRCGVCGWIRIVWDFNDLMETFGFERLETVYVREIVWTLEMYSVRQGSIAFKKKVFVQGMLAISA